MNVGRYIFAQITDFIPRYEFDKMVAKYQGDFHAKDLTCYNQLLHLLFGQLTSCDSLRDICLCLEAQKASPYHLGFRNTVTISSLSRANENAVKTHLWVAITAYLLLAKIKDNTQSPYSITEVATLIRVSALEKTELRELLTRPIDSILSNQNVKELTLFNYL